MKVTLRNDGVEISGYVNATDRESKPLRDAEGYFVERIEPGAFARSLAKHDPVMLLNHDHGRVLSTVADGLTVREDAVGLYAQAVVTDAAVVDKARAGRLSGWSFGFVPGEQAIDAPNGMRRKTVRSLDLIEVSLLDDTRTPAYIATSVMTRDDGEPLEVREMGDAPELVDEREEPAPEPPDMSAYQAIIEELSK